MVFQEPKMEFVPIDMSEAAISTSPSCTDNLMCDQYGVETCLGAAPMNSCPTEDDWL